MALMLGQLLEALREVGAGDKSAPAAAEKVANYDNRLAGIEARLSGVEARLGSMDSRTSVMTWVIGINVAITLVVLAKLLMLH